MSSSVLYRCGETRTLSPRTLTKTLWAVSRAARSSGASGPSMSPIMCCARLSLGIVTIPSSPAFASMRSVNEPMVSEMFSTSQSMSCRSSSDTIWSEQPLVRRRDQEVRPDLRNVEGMRPERLYRVDDQRRPCFAGALADACEVDERSVGPVAVRDGNNGGACVDILEQGTGPVAIFWTGEGDKSRPAPLRQLA